jgi:hypothetical protein
MKSPKPAPTPEEVMEMGRNWLTAQVARLPLEERLEGLKPGEVFSLYTPKERLMGLKQGLKPEEVFSLYAPQERVKGLKPEERIRDLKLEEVLDQFDPAQIDEYLRQSKRKKARSKNT